MEQIEYIALRPEQMQLISAELAWHYRIVPQAKAAGEYRFYQSEARDGQATKDELELMLGQAIFLEPIADARIETTLRKYYVRKETVTTVEDRQVVAVGAKSGQSEDFLTRLIYESKRLASSDIHIETYAEAARIRVRIDGLLVERYHLDKVEYPALVNRVKIMAGLDIAEKRLPQDGRIFFAKQGQRFDLRVSVVPTLYGEKIVLRLLSNDATNIDLNTLGFRPADLENYMEGVRRPTGILLISGPTGSGKTTTLYATLKLLNKESRNILTIEDPIEYTLEGINQVQLRDNIGLSFAAALRTFLRQDPDVIMVGEIRDPETANMAIRASLTGHLVLSTIHTNSAWGTVSRLIDMGIPPYLVASTLNTTVAQRLLRLLCPQCKQEVPFSSTVYPRRFKPKRTVERHCIATGCDACHYTGYRGRRAVYEVIPVDTDLADRIKHSQLQISELLRERDITSLADNAFELFEKGETSFDELYPLLFDGL